MPSIHASSAQYNYINTGDIGISIAPFPFVKKGMRHPICFYHKLTTMQQLNYSKVTFQHSWISERQTLFS